MKLILENSFDVNYDIEMNESTGEKNYIIKGVISTPDKKNKNGRIYPKKIWEKEVDRYINEDIEHNTYNTLSEWEHPARTSVDPMKAVAKCRKVWWDNDQVMGEFVILNNNSPETNQIKALIEQNMPIGVSTRGVGKLNNSIVEEYKWITTDLVQNPSNHASYLQGLRESGFDDSMIQEEKNYIITESGDIVCDENGCNLQNESAPVKVGDILTKGTRKGKVISVSSDMAQVDFGNGDVYGITFTRINPKEKTISEETTEQTIQTKEDNIITVIIETLKNYTEEPEIVNEAEEYIKNLLESNRLNEKTKATIHGDNSDSSLCYKFTKDSTNKITQELKKHSKYKNIVKDIEQEKDYSDNIVITYEGIIFDLYAKFGILRIGAGGVLSDCSTIKRKINTDSVIKAIKESK